MLRAILGLQKLDRGEVLFFGEKRRDLSRVGYVPQKLVVERVPEIPPSTRERAELQKTIREKKVKALFAEPGGSSALAKSIAEDTGIRLGELDPLETGVLNKESYVEGMRKNAEALVKGLK